MARSLPTASEAPSRLAADEVREFHERGFLVVPRLTTAADIEVIRRTLLALYRRFDALPRRQAVDLGEQAAPEAPQIPEINWTIELAPSLRRTLAFQRCAEIAAQLLGRPARHTGYDHAILKPARNACATAWHQDEAYVADGARRPTVHFWIPLQDVSVEMGCMHYIPGSHLGPVRQHRRRGGSADAHALEAVDVDGSLGVACPVAAGGATVHLPRTLHYSGPNLTDEPRLAWILEFGAAPAPWCRVLGALRGGRPPARPAPRDAPATRP